MFLDIHPALAVAIWLAYALGGFICAFNFSLPLRYYLARRRKLPPGPNVSPIPILGSLIVYLTLRVLGQLPLAKVIGYVLIAVDMGGIHWMIVGIAWQAWLALSKKLRG